ncbi:MAG TPA: hypothetical protein VFB50_02730 [Chloroflexota bacterium]|nr:hypothetical protein [Chloroflexota bacterium]
MKKTLVLFYCNAESRPRAAMGTWPNELDARAWLARAQVLYSQLRDVQLISMHGARDIKDVLDLLDLDPDDADADSATAAAD